MICFCKLKWERRILWPVLDWRDCCFAELSCCTVFSSSAQDAVGHQESLLN